MLANSLSILCSCCLSESSRRRSSEVESEDCSAGRAACTAEVISPWSVETAVTCVGVVRVTVLDVLPGATVVAIVVEVDAPAEVLDVVAGVPLLAIAMIQNCSKKIPPSSSLKVHTI